MAQVSVSEEVTFVDIIRRGRDFLLFLLRRWKLILPCAVIFTLAGIFYASSKETTYIADTSFSIDEEKSNGGGNLLGLAATFGLDLGGGGNLFTNENILQLFSSRKIVYAALLEPSWDNKTTYADQVLTFTGLREALNIRNENLFQINEDQKSFSRLKDSVLNVLYKKTTKSFFHAEKPDKKVDIYHVTVESPDENFSQTFGKSIVNQVSKLYTEIKTLKSKQTVDILQKRVDSLKGNYTRALYGQAAILDANINPAVRSATVGAAQKQAEITTSTGAYQELLKNLEMSKYALLKQSPLFRIIDEPRFPLDKRKPSRLIFGIAFGMLGTLMVVLILVIKRFLQNI